MVRSIRLRLADIITEIRSIQAALGHLSFKEFESNRIVRAAIERGIEIISEASRHLPDTFEDANPELPWRRIADIGNVLRHA